MLGAVACGDGSAGAEAPVATASCAEVELPPVQFGSHLLGDAQPPTPYSSTPASSGWHQSGPPPLGVFDEPLPEPAIVSALEVGAVGILHDGLSSSELQSLTDHVEQQGYGSRTTITPYPDLPEGRLTLVAWGVVQRCTDVDGLALDRFVGAYAADEVLPEEPRETPGG